MWIMKNSRTGSASKTHIIFFLESICLSYFYYYNLLLQIKQWCKEAGEGVTFEFEQKNSPVECTKTDDSNIYWVAFKSVADEL